MYRSSFQFLNVVYVLCVLLYSLVEVRLFFFCSEQAVANDAVVFEVEALCVMLVSDANDNPPLFQNPAYEAYLFEVNSFYN